LARKIENLAVSRAGVRIHDASGNLEGGLREMNIGGCIRIFSNLDRCGLHGVRGIG
jgi:hypothetical protein